jgi:hypothetical protein
MAWAALESHIESLKICVIMQCIKETSTLRISPKGEKPPPRIIMRYGDQEGQIRRFILYNMDIKKAGRKTQSADH